MIKKIFSIFIISELFIYKNAFAAFGIEKVNDGLKGTDNADIASASQDVVAYFLMLLAFIALVWSMKGGYEILTAAGDDEKVKKGKKTVLFTLLGLFIIVLAGTFTDGFITSVNTN